MKSSIGSTMVRVRFAHWGVVFFIVILSGTLLHFFYQSKIRHTGDKFKQTMEIIAQAGQLPDQETFQKQLEALRRNLSRMGQRTFKQGDQARAVSVLTHLIQELEISMIRLEPVALKEGPSSQGGSKAEIKPIQQARFTLEIESTYRQWGEFLEGLAEEDLAFHLESFEVKPQAAQPGILHISAIIVAYEEMMVLPPADAKGKTKGTAVPASAGTQ